MRPYYILKGKEVVTVKNLQTWGAWFENHDRHVAKTVIGEVTISTVFLGIDYSFINGNPPVLFETMIFGGELNESQERYRTYEEAEIGHAKWVERVQEGKTND